MAAPKGNRFAAKSGEWADAIRRAIREKHGSDWQAAIKRMAKPLIEAAEAGDMSALIEIGNRLDGKPHQTSEVTVRRGLSARDLPTDELAAIALGSGEGTAEEAGGESIDSQLH